jgi:8-oxo-dGTP pyrophosphatase MutT (NUDIX family)
MDILNQPGDVFPARIRQALDGRATLPRCFWASPDASAVLFLLARSPAGEPVVILNKRSRQVRQPGDLCFPGGSIAPGRDGLIAKILTLPHMPTARFAKHRGRGLSLLLATGLRESFEEMRLNPFNVAYLGLLPTQRLVMFQRDIHPLVCWVSGQRRFFPNWEVEKVIFVPLKNLLEPEGYARYHLEMVSGSDPSLSPEPLQVLCFRIGDAGAQEFLWGATFRIILTFLDIVFGFTPPDPGALPVVFGRLDETYMGRPGDRLTSMLRKRQPH